MSVEENLIMGTLYGNAKANRSKTMERVYGLFPRLRKGKSSLPDPFGGEQQMLAVGRGLMSLPKLHDVSTSLPWTRPDSVQDIFRIVRKINEEGVTVLLVEQNVRQNTGDVPSRLCARKRTRGSEGTGQALMPTST